MPRSAWLVLWFSVVFVGSVAAQGHPACAPQPGFTPDPKLRLADLDDDWCLCGDEVRQLLLALDKLKELGELGVSLGNRARIVEDLRVDVLTATSTVGANCVRLDEFDGIVDGLPDRTEEIIKKVLDTSKNSAELKSFLPRYLSVRRRLRDPYDSSFSVNRPAVISYLRDEEADDRDQLTLVGSVRLNGILLNPQSTGANFVRFSPGISADIDGSDSAEESTVTLETPVEWKHVRQSRVLRSSTFVFTPRFITDRDFDREVWEFGLGWTFSSRAIRSRYLVFRGDTIFQWSPSFEIAVGEIEDAAGNEDLVALGELGDYTRLLGDLSFLIERGESFSFGVDYSHWFDLDNEFDRGFLEVSIGQDLTSKGAVKLAITYRRGRRPPDFRKRDQLLLSLGFLKEE